MKASSLCSRVESSTSDAFRPPPSGDPSTETYVDPTAAVDPLSSTSSDSSLHAMLDTIMTVQATHGQLLLDVLNELHASMVDARGSTS